MPPGLLAGQVCAVSGAGTGLGRATALELARLGAIVIGCGRRPEPLAQTARAVAAEGGEAGYQALDVRESEAAERFVDGILERHGRLDVLVNNAGGPVPEPRRGDHAEGLPDRARAERPGHLADDPRRGDEGIHPGGAAAR